MGKVAQVTRRSLGGQVGVPDGKAALSITAGCPQLEPAGYPVRGQPATAFPFAVG
jgi:hypothetical protein